MRVKGLAARPYQGEADLRAMQLLVQRVWSKKCHIHIGDLAWQRGRWKAGKPDWPTMLWEIDGVTVAWGWMQLPNEFEFLVDTAVPGLADIVLGWAKGAAPDAQLKTAVLDTETHLIEALLHHGFQAVDGWFFDYMSRPLSSCPMILSAGCRFTAKSGRSCLLPMASAS